MELFSRNNFIYHIKHIQHGCVSDKASERSESVYLSDLHFVIKYNPYINKAYRFFVSSSLTPETRPFSSKVRPCSPRNR